MPADLAQLLVAARLEAQRRRHDSVGPDRWARPDRRARAPARAVARSKRCRAFVAAPSSMRRFAVELLREKWTTTLLEEAGVETFRLLYALTHRGALEDLPPRDRAFGHMRREGIPLRLTLQRR